MNNTPSSERKFDTLRLLDGVPNTGEYRAEDILREFSRPTVSNQATARLGAVPLNPPPKPDAPVSNTSQFFGAPPEVDTLGEDFWDPPEESDTEDLWAEIESMGRGARKKSRSAGRPASPAAAAPSPSAPYQPQPAFSEVESPGTSAPQERESARARRRKLQEAETRTPKPDVPPERAVRHYRQRAASARRRLPLLLLLSLLAAYFTLAASYGWAAPSLPVLCRLLAGLSLAALLLCYDLVIETVYDLCRGRLRMETLLLASTICCAVDAFLCADAKTPHVPFPLLPTLGWLLSLWAAYHHRLALRRTAKVLEKLSSPMAIRSAPSLWNGTDCIVKTSGDITAFLRELEERDYASQLMQYYVPIVLIGTTVLSAVATVGRDGSFPQALSAMMAAATPLAGALCFTRPFSLLSRRLYRSQAALCGWLGAELLGGHQAVVIRDEDLFPAASATMNGAKFYGDFDKAYVISCAATIFHESGGDLAPVFEAMARDFRTSFGQMSSYRAYEGGGYGANIGQDIVLVGSVGFIRLMGISIPDGTNIRQAVYVAINNELAGVFSINYAPDRRIRNGLDALCTQRRLTCLCATRDFILNPALLRQRFHLSGGRLEFPQVDERMRLSTPEVGANGRRAALLSRDSFADYSDVVAGGRNLYNLTRVSSIFCIFSGIIGLVLIFILHYLGATISATVTNLLLYCLLWALPPLLITSWVDKY